MMGEHLLAANHLVMGTTNIAQLGLPQGWRVVDGHAAPEVDRWTEYRGCRWMSQGRAPYRLVQSHPEQPGLVRAEVELLVTAEPLTGTAEHGATVSRGTAWRGLLPRREVPVASLLFSCPETGRRLVLDLSVGMRTGAPTASAEDLESLLGALQRELRCH